MGNSQRQSLDQLSTLLTPIELEKLSRALETIMAGGSGWGDLLIRFKSGRMDTIEITSSILVRDRTHDRD